MYLEAAAGSQIAAFSSTIKENQLPFGQIRPPQEVLRFPHLLQRPSQKLRLF